MMSIFFRSATFGLAALLLIGCDENQLDPLDRETQPAVNDRQTISPDAQLPRPDSPRQPEYSVTPPAEAPAVGQPGSTDSTAQPPAAGPGASTEPGVSAGTGSGAGASGGTDAEADTATGTTPGGAAANAASDSQAPPAPVAEEPAVEEVPAGSSPSGN